MARPTKEGLDYFPFDVDIFEDEKIEAIAGEFGIKGELFVVKLLCAIYKKGYFVVWNDLTKSHFLKRVPGSSKELLEQIVNRLVTWEFFDKDLFNSAKVLTSENIQETYFEATKRRKSPKPTKYIINVDINPVSEEVNADINTQSKVNESKSNKTKTNKNKESSSSDISHNPENSAVEFWCTEVQTDEAPFVLQSIQHWVNDFGGQNEIVIMGIKEMRENNARSYKYLDKILKTWEDKKLDTPQKVRNYLDGRYTDNQTSGQKKSQWTDDLLFDYWYAEKMSGKPSVPDFAAQKNLTDVEIERLIRKLNSKGYYDTGNGEYAMS